METAVSHRQAHQTLASKPPPPAIKFATLHNANIKPLKLRQVGFAQLEPDPVCALALKNRHSLAPVRSNPVPARNGHQMQSATSSARDLSVHETNYRKHVATGLPPIKPKIIPNDLLEYEYERYLDERLMRSLLEEDKKMTRNIIADEELVPQLCLYFQKREIGITRAKNSIIYLKLKDLETFDSFISSLSKLTKTFSSNISSTLSSLTSNLHDSLHMIRVSNCTFTLGEQDMWSKLAASARMLNVVLCSEEKAFYFISLMNNTFKDVEKQMESLEQNIQRKVSLQQNITFLTSLRLSYLLAKKNEQGMGNENELPHVSSVEKDMQAEELKNPNNTSSIYPDITFCSIKSAS